MNAEYTTSLLYPGNPYVEALPPMLAGQELIRALASVPPYSASDRDRSTGERLQLLSALYEFYQPLTMTLDLYCEVYNAMQHCYGQYTPQREAAAFQQGVNVRTAQRLAAQTAAHPARHAPRRGKAFARLGLLGLVENAYTQTVQSNRFARAVQTDDGPADRRHADVQPDAIQCVFHNSTSFGHICTKGTFFHSYHARMKAKPSISTVDKNIRVFWEKKMTPR